MTDHSMPETLLMPMIVHPEHPVRTILQIFGGCRSGSSWLALLKKCKWNCLIGAIGTIADMVSLTDENVSWFNMVWKCWDILSASVYKEI